MRLFITCDLARQWLKLRRTQELAKLKAEVSANAVTEVAASNAPTPPLVGVCSSPDNRTPPISTGISHPISVSISPPRGASRSPPISTSRSPPPVPAPTPTQSQQQGLRFRNLNDVADLDDAIDKDDCAKLDCEDDYSVVSLADSRRMADLNSFGNDFS